MPGSVKVGGAWKTVKSVSVKVGGNWKVVKNGYTKIGGAWKQWHAGVTYWIVQNQITGTVYNDTSMGISATDLGMYSAQTWNYQGNSNTTRKLNLIINPDGTLSSFKGYASADSGTNNHRISSGGNVIARTLGTRLNFYNATTYELIASRDTGTNPTPMVTSNAGNTYMGNNYSPAKVVKWTPTGTIAWIKDYVNTPWNMNTAGLSVDANDNTYPVYRYSTVAHVAKINSSGVLQWTVEGNNVQSSFYTRDTAGADSAGNVYANAYCTDPANGSYSGTVIYKLNSSGTPQWNLEIYSNSHLGFDVTDGVVDAAGNSYWVGTFVIPYGGGGGYNSGFMMKVNSSGGVDWFKILNRGGSVGGQNEFDRLQIAADADSLYVAFANQSDYRSYYMRYPFDGSINGTYTVGGNNVNIANSGGYSTATRSTFSFQATSYTLTNGSYTNNAATVFALSDQATTYSRIVTG
jgi:hypothetical protein